jgi:hypothetical protein
LGKLLWKDALSWTIDVIPGYLIDDPNLGMGRRGEPFCKKKVE